MDEERSYYYRLVCLMVDLGTEVLRKVFIKYIPPGQTVAQYLESKSKEVTNLTIRKLLNDTQLNLILNADEDEFDISLLYVLIRNLIKIKPPTNGWNSPCSEPSDKSPGRFMNELKTMRNEAVAHRPKAALKRLDFEKFWEVTENALVELAGEVGPQEKAAIQPKIKETKSKPLLGTDYAKLDALLKWDIEDKYLNIAYKLDELTEQIKKQDVTKDVDSIKLSIREINDQLKSLGVQNAHDAGPSSQIQARQTVTDGMSTENGAENKAMRQQVSDLMNTLKQAMALNPCEGVGFQGDGSIPTNQTNQSKKTTVHILGNCMKSVGCLVTPFGRGTAFRVGDGFLITVFQVIKEVSDDMYTKDRQTDDPGNPIPFVFVNFNECLDLPSQVVYRLNPPCFTDIELDVAILEIVNPNSFLPPRLPLSKIEGPKSKVSIIGYGHPGTNSKSLDLNCPVLAANSDRVVGAINQVWSEIGTIRQNLINPDIVNTSFDGYDDPSRFLLDCVFEHGGSGSPAIDHEVPASTKVVGIYFKGFPTFFFELPKHMQYKYRDVFRFEMCTRTSSLYSVLLAYDEALTNNIFG